MTLKNTSESVTIENVKGFSPDEYVSSFYAIQARILKVLGKMLSYDDLICYGTFAFRIGIHEKI